MKNFITSVSMLPFVAMLELKAHSNKKDGNPYLYEEKFFQRSEHQMFLKSIHIFKGGRNFYTDLKSLTYCRASPHRREQSLAGR